MKMKASCLSVAIVLAAALIRMTLSAAERPYAFRAELETVHEPGLRDATRTAAADEFAFADGAVVSIPAEADEVLATAARDFTDYLRVSMNVDAIVSIASQKDGMSDSRRDGDHRVYVKTDPSLSPREYVIDVTKSGVTVCAADSRAAAQALYHLEDLMNLRRAPFLKIGEETRRMRFATRMVHSGWGMDVFPEKYVARVAHAGYDSLVVYIKRVGKTKSSEAIADVNAIIRRAARYGLGVWLYTSVRAYVHPDDPGAQKVFDDSYGAIAAAYPEAKGIVLVGESCAFPSRDERTCADPYEEKVARGDNRPAPGWFPCRDYPAWLRCVEAAVHRHAPAMKVVFWTYNWAEDRTPEVPAARLKLIDNLPAEGTVLQSTFEMPEKVTFPNGYAIRVSDYSIACPGPGANFVREATRARARGLELFTMCNTAGHTWDFGTAPYQPIPFQWAKRNRALVAAEEKWGLSGLMESHHYGWSPSFVSELAKEAFTEGGLPFERHVRAIAARDFGERNAEEVVAMWKRWSDHAANQPPTLGNQYGPLRIGPAYPFNFGGAPVGDDDLPHDVASAHKFAGMCHLNFDVPLWGEEMYDRTNVTRQVELLRPAADDYLADARRLREMSGGLPPREAAKAARMAGLAEYLGRTLLTTVHLQLGAVAWEKKDWPSLLALGRAERANAVATLPLVDADSSLGFECSMEYVGGRPQIEWKIRRLDERLADYAKKMK